MLDECPIRQLPSFLYFYFYSWLRSGLLRRLSHQSSKAPLLSIPQELAIGFLAGVTRRIISTPLSLVTVRLQMEREESNEDINEAGGGGEAGEGRGEEVRKSRNGSKGLAGVVKSIYRQDGLAGFWKGVYAAFPNFRSLY